MNIAEKGGLLLFIIGWSASLHAEQPIDWALFFLFGAVGISLFLGFGDQKGRR